MKNIGPMHGYLALLYALGELGCCSGRALARTRKLLPKLTRSGGRKAR